MKTPRIVNATGFIDEGLIEGAMQQKSTKKTVWLRWTAAAAACICFVMVAAFVLPEMLPSIGPEQVIDEQFSNAIAYVGWTEDERIYTGAVNKELLQSGDGEHLPVFLIDTPEDLAAFKSQYQDVFAMDQGHNDIRSLEQALAQTQWDRAAFYEEHTLMLVYIPANSSTYRYGIQRVDTSDTSLTVRVEVKNNPNTVSDDMAGWMLLVLVDDEEIAKYTQIDAILAER